MFCLRVFLHLHLQLLDSKGFLPKKNWESALLLGLTRTCGTSAVRDDEPDARDVEPDARDVEPDVRDVEPDVRDVAVSPDVRDALAVRGKEPVAVPDARDEPIERGSKPVLVRGNVTARGNETVGLRGGEPDMMMIERSVNYNLFKRIVRDLA